MSSVLIFTAHWSKSTRLDSQRLQQAFFKNHLFVKVGQHAGNPAATPGVQVCAQATHNFSVTAAAISGDRNPYQQDTTGLSFVVDDSPDFLFEAGHTHGYENPAASGWLRKIAPSSSVVRAMAENLRPERRESTKRCTVRRRQFPDSECSCLWIRTQVNF